MSDIILQIRTDTLARHITRLRDILTQLGRRVKDVQTLDNAVAETQADVRDLTRGIERLQDLIRDYQAANRPVQADELVNFDETLDQSRKLALRLFTTLRQARGSIDSMQSHAFRFRDEVFRKSLENAVVEKTNQYQDAVNRISQKLETDRATAWNLYKEEIRRPVQSFFAEIVELLGGVALRDTRLDDGICKLADELVTHYQVERDMSFSVLTIPGRQQAISMTLARIVRVGFPEWTIWALPLTAREFWYVAGRRVIVGEDNSNRIAGRTVDAAMQQCMADAFATCLIGPAYPCAQVLLGLDPFDAYTAVNGNATDDDRVHAMMAVLGLMNRPGGKSFTNVIKELFDGWTTALAYAKPDGNRDLARQAEITLVVESLFERLAFGAFPVTAWDDIAELSQQLATTDLPGIKGNIDDPATHRELDGMHLGIPFNPELRHLLNAAWRARLAAPEEAERIDANTRLLWAYLVRKREEPVASIPRERLRLGRPS